MKVSPLLRDAVLKLALIIGIVTVLYFGQSVLLTLTLGGMLAIVLNPIDEKLRSWGWSKNFAIAGAVFVLLVFFAGLFFAVGKQAARFAENWPKIEQRIGQQIEKAKRSLPIVSGERENDQGKENANAGEEEAGAPEPTEAIGSDNTTGNIIDSMPVNQNQVTGFLSTTVGILGDFFLTLVYVVLFLAQKERLREFILRQMPDSKRGVTHQTINESTMVAQRYLKGRLILIAILSVLYTVGFMLSGMDYAIVVAVLAAVLSIIPYLGNIIGGVLAMAIAMAGGGSTDAFIGIIVTMTVAQMLESYILTPLIVGDEVDINPLTTIVAVIGFSVLWGAVGAIVAIPIVAIVRIICSHVDGLRDYAYLLGQE